MSERPLRNLTLGDFRRVEGTRRISLDAPVVLIHGPNGTGKTSILSALEMALTGRVSSMARQDEHYTAHLPYTGQPFATVQVDVAETLRPTLMDRMTIAGSRVTGQPALNAEQARFYSERCYLDQTSLGRLLELYQVREGKQESILARFVNELLGLEDLDALRTGLHDATNLRTLKKLVDRLAEADDAAKRAERDETEASKQRVAAAQELDHAVTQTVELLAAAGISIPGTRDIPEILQLARQTEPNVVAALRQALNTDRELAGLRGRVAAVAERTTTQRRNEAQAALQAATARKLDWQQQRQPVLASWVADAEFVGIDLTQGWVQGVTAALSNNATELAEQERLRRERAVANEQHALHRAALTKAESELAAAQLEASSLVEGLAAVQGVITDDICPVCDRNYAELGAGHLGAHVQNKIARLAVQGTQLVELRRRRDELAQLVDQSRRDLAVIDNRLLSPERLADLGNRQVTLEGLSARLNDLDPVIRESETVNADEQAALRAADQLDTADSEHAFIGDRLADFAERLHTTISVSESPSEACVRLVELSARAVEQLQSADLARREMAEASRRLKTASDAYQAATTRVAEAVDRRTAWEGYVTEAKRRQRIARDVHDAASAARTTIVQRVFTESLNNVWADLFTRLAPNEEFIPSFGIPSATRTALEVTLETHLRNGDPGGPPQMMLSAGNLNTAALSLFLALHLAVEPVVPCLVFDDPVQAMDEVHVAQFAALIRTLAKQHGRQVVIAVHERELFDYLALELSPAYEGDSLITIELGERSDDPDGGVGHLRYVDDRAITG